MRKRTLCKSRFLNLFGPLMALFLSGCGTNPQGPIVLREGEILVQPGETIYSLAEKHNVGVRELVESNQLKEPFSLSPYQKLTLPHGNNGSSSTGEKALSGQEEEGGPKLLHSSEEPVWTDCDEAEVWTDGKKVPQPSAPPLSSGENKKNRNLGQEKEGLDPKNSGLQVLSELAKNTPSKPASSKSAPTQSLTATQESTQKKDRAPRFIKPVKGSCSAPFNRKKRQFGVHFKTKTGANVSAAQGGTVLCAQKVDAEYPMVLIQHDDNTVSAYFPLAEKSLQVKAGQKVSQGQTLGRSAESELFFQWRDEKQTPQDPMPFMK